MLRIITLLLFFTSSLLNCAPYTVNLTATQIENLGLLIWKNEGQQKVEHLTAWNKGEDFPSLGLGHFIWYPSVKKGPFKEQFPQLLQFMGANNVVLPQWLTEAQVAPWQSREQFYEQFDGPQLTQLRALLHVNLPLQVRFIILRLESAIPLIFEDSTAIEKEKITRRLSELSTSEGIFTLLDYVNFKGEGVNPKESYQGKGWGLKQVLLAMPEQSNNALRSFAFAADEILTRRVKNAPRDESRWLKGWRIRIHAYPNLNIK